MTAPADDFPVHRTLNPVTAAEQWERMIIEIDRLRRWKAEATEVIAGWGLVWEAAGQPGFLGATKSQSVRAYIATLIADTLTAQDRVERDRPVIEAARAVQAASTAAGGFYGLTVDPTTSDAMERLFATLAALAPDEVNEAET